MLRAWSCFSRSVLLIYVIHKCISKYFRKSHFGFLNGSTYLLVVLSKLLRFSEYQSWEFIWIGCYGSTDSRGRLLGKLYVISVPIWNTEVGLNRGEISRLVDGRIQSISYDMSLHLGGLEWGPSLVLITNLREREQGVGLERGLWIGLSRLVLNP